MALTGTQIQLAPETAFDPATPGTYVTVRWRWGYLQDVSAWFVTRDAAIQDAESAHPGIGCG